jgi:hypothetical protein
MRKFLAVLTIVLFVAMAGVVQATDFVNGGFESGNLTGWTGGGGNWSAYGDVSPKIYVPYTGLALPTASQYVGGTPNNTVVGVGTDPITGQNTVYNGQYSVRVNDSYNNYSVSTISQSVKGYSSNQIYFEWNAVLQSSHGLSDSDYFALTLTDDTTKTVLYNTSFSSASAPGIFTYYPSDWYGSGWQVEDLNVTAGHDFTLSLLASDCPYGGHAGYVYLDGFGAVVVPPTNNVPEPATMLLLGLGLVGLAGVRRKLKG